MTTTTDDDNDGETTTVAGKRMKMCRRSSCLPPALGSFVLVLGLLSSALVGLVLNQQPQQPPLQVNAFSSSRAQGRARAQKLHFARANDRARFHSSFLPYLLHHSTAKIGHLAAHQQRLSPLHATTTNGDSPSELFVDDENKKPPAIGGHGRRRRLRQRVTQKAKQSVRKLSTWMRHVLLWQRRTRQSLIAAAVLALSVFLVSDQSSVASYHDALHQQPASNAPPVEWVVQNRHSSATGMEATMTTTTTTTTLYSSSFANDDALVASSSQQWSSSTATSTTSSALTSSLPRGGSASSATASRATSSSSSSSKNNILRFWNSGSDSEPEQATMPAKNNNNNKRGRKTQALVKIEHAVEEGVATASVATGRTLREAANDLYGYMRGPKSDTLLLLLATALITPLCKRLSTSPILGFLAAGMLLGPNGCGLISGIHTTETLAELGIVFFLFEMGIELSFERLLSMRKDVFGLGLSQFLVSALGVAIFGALFGGLPANALIVLGGGLALSSSAFVLQLLKDKNQLATRFGRASFGVLLFQDLAVVPLLVVTPILAGSGSGLAAAIGSAVVKAGMALGSIALTGRFVLNPLFKTVAQAQSQEAFLALILLTVLSMSFMTEGLGLSNTLGAFLAGVLLSETKYRYQVEADIAPFRGILLGLFFVTVGFEIDLSLIAAQLPLVGSLVLGILALKAAVTTALSLAFGLSLPTSLQTGLLLSQGGEFAFVAFGLARSLGILSSSTTKLMLTSVSLTMALTPLMSSIGGRIAKRLEEETDFTHYLGQDRDASEIKESDDFTVVVGYGAVGKIVCDLLDRKLMRYVGLEIDPNKAIQARNAGLPVFYGDIGRQEVAEAFNVGKAKAVIVCIADKQQANRAVIALRRWYPELKIFARAVDADHASRLQNTLNVVAMVPILPDDNLLLTLPFGGAVMKALGVAPEEVNAILENKRKEVMKRRGLEESEEEAALVQLGIDMKIVDGDGEVDEEVREQLFDKAAAERRQQALEKSPFVAEVIEDVCPGSVCVEDDEEDELLAAAGNTTEEITAAYVDLSGPAMTIEASAIPSLTIEASSSAVAPVAAPEVSETTEVSPEANAAAPADDSESPTTDPPSFGDETGAFQ